jgi:hypothetical protein
MTRFSPKFCGLARSIAASTATPEVARTMMSPKAANSADVPDDARLHTSLK